VILVELGTSSKDAIGCANLQFDEIVVNPDHFNVNARHHVHLGGLTISLSGQAQRPFRAAEHAIHCEDGAASLTAGPLQRVVRQHVTP